MQLPKQFFGLQLCAADVGNLLQFLNISVQFTCDTISRDVNIFVVYSLLFKQEGTIAAVLYRTVSKVNKQC